MRCQSLSNNESSNDDEHRQMTSRQTNNDNMMNCLPFFKTKKDHPQEILLLLLKKEEKQQDGECRQTTSPLMTMKKQWVITVRWLIKRWQHDEGVVSFFFKNKKDDPWNIVLLLFKNKRKNNDTSIVVKRRVVEWRWTLSNDESSNEGRQHDESSPFFQNKKAPPGKRLSCFQRKKNTKKLVHSNLRVRLSLCLCGF